jgi:hypothetical protein
MTEVLSLLDEVLIESAIEDDNGRKFWKTFFVGKVVGATCK